MPDSPSDCEYGCGLDDRARIFFVSNLHFLDERLLQRLQRFRRDYRPQSQRPLKTVDETFSRRLNVKSRAANRI